MGMGLEQVGFSIGHNGAVMEDDHPVGVPLHNPKIMGDQNDSCLLYTSPSPRD